MKLSCFASLFACFLFLFPHAVSGQSVTVSIPEGDYSSTVKGRIETNASALLTEINRAHQNNRELNLSSVGHASSLNRPITMLWENCHFMCLDEKIVENCLETGSGYQIRNIPFLMTPTEGDDLKEEYQEGVINFDREGKIESLYLTISNNLYMSVVKKGKDVSDLRRRQLILDYVERFRTAYNQKDLDFLEQVFSDDALIITGKVITRKTSDGIRLPDKITYKKYTKREYLDHLKISFRSKSYIRVSFDEIMVKRHPTLADFYGVTLHQGYSSSNYHDDGYLFLLWDFQDESRPQIHVRTWQPDSYNGKRLPEDEIFSLADFDLE